MKKMDKKNITFYKKFILQTKTLSDGGMILYVTNKLWILF